MLDDMKYKPLGLKVIVVILWYLATALVQYYGVLKAASCWKI